VSDLVSMKLSAKDRDKLAPQPSLVEKDDRPRYPYGLQINMDDDTLDKLKLATLPKVGTKLTLVALVEVTSVSSHQSTDSDKHQNVGLQITECCLEPAATLAKVEDALYGEEENE